LSIYQNLNKRNILSSQHATDVDVCRRDFTTITTYVIYESTGLEFIIPFANQGLYKLKTVMSGVKKDLVSCPNNKSRERERLGEESYRHKEWNPSNYGRIVAKIS
jgi:hypothetical protein